MVSAKQFRRCAKVMIFQLVDALTANQAIHYLMVSVTLLLKHLLNHHSHNHSLSRNNLYSPNSRALLIQTVPKLQ